MASDLTPFHYRQGNSLLHRLGAGKKILGLFVLSTLPFVAGGWGCAAAALVIVGLSLPAHIQPLSLLRGSRALFWMAAFVVAFRSVSIPLAFSRAGCVAGLLFGTQMYTAFAAGSLFFAVTRHGEVRALAERVNPALGLAFSLMLKFLPLFFEVWEDRSLAWTARGGGRGVRALFYLVPSVMEKMLEKAVDTATALEARGA
jgi:energy-coupling factor transporter transmembrane protein EcfT